MENTRYELTQVEDEESALNTKPMEVKDKEQSEDLVSVIGQSIYMNLFVWIETLQNIMNLKPSWYSYSAINDYSTIYRC